MNDADFIASLQEEASRWKNQAFLEIEAGNTGRALIVHLIRQRNFHEKRCTGLLGDILQLSKEFAAEKFTKEDLIHDLVALVDSEVEGKAGG